MVKERVLHCFAIVYVLTGKITTSSTEILAPTNRSGYKEVSLLQLSALNGPKRSATSPLGVHLGSQNVQVM